MHEDATPAADLRAARGVQFGDGNAQYNYFILTDSIERSASVLAPPVGASLGRLLDLGQAPAVDEFFGRDAELAALRTSLSAGRRIFIISARGGMGKTTLAARFATMVAENYEVVIWRSVYNCQPLVVLLRDLLGVLAPDRRFDHDVSSAEMLAHLLVQLRGRRCLLILDNLESLLTGDGSGRFLPPYQDYADLLSLLAREDHDSSVLVTTREVPEAVAVSSDAVQLMRLAGLNAEASHALIRSRRLATSVRDGARVAEVYGGNPLELMIAAENIRVLYRGDVDAFLADGVATSGDTFDLLVAQTSRLDPLAGAALCWLAIRREPVTVDELVERLVPAPGSKRLVVDAVSTLVDRSLASVPAPGRFATQPVIAEFVVEHLLDALHREILGGHPDRLIRFALKEASAKDYIRSAQERVLVRPLADRLQDSITARERNTRFRVLLDRLRQGDARARLSNGYGAANVLHLALATGVDLTGYDFSGLDVREACLQGVKLHDVSFRDARFVRTSFTDTFGVVETVAAAPDGELIAAGTEAGDIRLWRRRDGQAVATWREHLNLVAALEFSPDGRWLGSAGADRTIRVWELRTGRCVRVLRGHERAVHDLSWHPTRALIASAGYDNTVRLWNTITGEQLRVLDEHDNWVREVAFSTAGDLLVSCSLDGTVRVWRTDDWACLGVLRHESDSYWCVAISPDGRLIAAGDYDGNVRLWDWPEGVPRSSVLTHNDRVWSVAFVPDSRLMVTAGNDRLIWAWDRDAGTRAVRFEGHRLGVNSTRVIPGTRYIVSGAGDQTVRVWSLDTGACHLQLEGYEQPVRTVAWSPEGQLIATAGNDGDIHLWHPDGTCLRSLTGHGDVIDKVAFNPAGTKLASACVDHTIRLWDVASGRCLAVLTGHAGYISSVTFSPDGQRLASGGQHRALFGWDATTGRKLFQVDAYDSTINSICFTPDGDHLITGGGDHHEATHIHDSHTGELVTVLSSEHHGGVTGLALTPGGEHAVVGLASGIADVWHLPTRRLVGSFEGHDGYIRAVASHPDGRTIATAGDDRVIQLWHLDRPEPLRQLVGHTQSVAGLAFSMDGRRLVSASADGTTRIWQLDDSTVETLVPPRPYEGVDITGAGGLSETQSSALRVLGAIGTPRK
jgi:WD40 repeat protein